MTRKIFYCWQSTLPFSTNHDFIQQALEIAIEAINKNLSGDERVELDRDTFGIPGTPDITQAVLDKIKNDDVFVCDLSIINKSTDFQPKATSNPNVLIEFGYALGIKGWTNIIVVMNTAFGGHNYLPFDVRNRIAVPYDLPEHSTNTSTEQTKLANDLEGRLRLVLGAFDATFIEKALLAVNDGKSGFSAIHKFMTNIVEEISRIATEYREFFLDSGLKDDEESEKAVEGIAQLVGNFAKLADAIATKNSEDAGIALFEDFSQLVEFYGPVGALTANGNSEQIGIIFRIMGHDLFLVFISFLLLHESWGIIERVFETPLYIKNQEDYVTFRHISQQVGTASGHFHYTMQLLEKIHQSPSLNKLVSPTDLMNSDFFLYSTAQLPSTEILPRRWFVKVYPRNGTSRFLKAARSRKYAENLCKVFDLPDFDALRTHITLRRDEIREKCYAVFQAIVPVMDDLDVAQIASIK